MTSSEVTELRPGAIAAAAERVGSCEAGDPVRASTSGPRLAIVAAKFNGGITERLLQGALDALDSHGIERASLVLVWVPGAFEIPVAALHLCSSGGLGALIALGAVIRGDTPHFDYVAGECAAGCREVALSTGVPVVFGVLTTDDVEQALERSAPGPSNKGFEAALTALEMCDLLSRIPARVVAGD